MKKSNLFTLSVVLAFTLGAAALPANAQNAGERMQCTTGAGLLNFSLSDGMFLFEGSGRTSVALELSPVGVTDLRHLTRVVATGSVPEGQFRFELTNFDFANNRADLDYKERGRNQAEFAAVPGYSPSRSTCRIYSLGGGE